MHLRLGVSIALLLSAAPASARDNSAVNLLQQAIERAFSCSVVQDYTGDVDAPPPPQPQVDYTYVGVDKNFSVLFTKTDARHETHYANFNSPLSDLIFSVSKKDLVVQCRTAGCIRRGTASQPECTDECANLTENSFDIEQISSATFPLCSEAAAASALAALRKLTE